jgi:hypothetical protein
MFLTLPLMNSGAVNFENGEVVGYTAIFLSFLLVFFGIRSYRESSGGTMSWEIIYFNVMPDFGDKYAARTIEKMRQKGASDAAIAAKQIEMEKMKAMFNNPLTNAAVSFIEPFPVGLLVTLVSAAILRTRTPAAHKFITCELHHG